MQTFITYPTFSETAKSLDDKRLGKQRLEAKQILDRVLWLEKMLDAISEGDCSVDEFEDEFPRPTYSRHPAVLQWVGYSECLKLYLNAMIDEWVERGFKNTMEHANLYGAMVLPWWLEEQYKAEVIRTHRIRLMQKNSDYYSFKYLWFNVFKNDGELPALDLKTDYYWPVHIDKVKRKGKVANWEINGKSKSYLYGL